MIAEIYISDLWAGLIGGCGFASLFWIGLAIIAGLYTKKKREG